MARIFQSERERGGGVGVSSMSNRWFSPDLSCRPPRRVLLNVTFYTCSLIQNSFKQVSFSAKAFAAKNEDISMAFSLH